MPNCPCLANMATNMMIFWSETSNEFCQHIFQAHFVAETSSDYKYRFYMTMAFHDA